MVQGLWLSMMRIDEVRMCGAEVSGELVQGVVSNKDTGRDVQHAVFSIEVLNGGAAAGRVTFAKDFLKVAVQKLNNSIFHSSIPCLLFGAARRQVAFARTRLPPPYRRMGLFHAPDECCRTGFGATRPPTR